MSKSSKLEYICEHCYSDQSEDGFCLECQITKGQQNPVVEVRKFQEQYGKTVNEMTLEQELQTWKSWGDGGYYGHNKAEQSEQLSLYSGLGSLSMGSSSTYAPYASKKVERPRRARSWRENGIWFIGDIHGNIEEYQTILKKIHDEDPDAITIQVGDLELGDNELPKLGANDYFIQGNHDDINACMKHPNFLGKFGYKNGVFYMGGAQSKGLGYSHEELSDAELQAAVELYCQVQPEIVVTHDCPQSIAESWHMKKESTRTGEALEEMWKAHNPHVWAYGHYHWEKDEVFDGCQFICVNAMEAQQVQLAWTLGGNKYQKPSKPTEMTKGKVIGHFLNKFNLFK